MQLPERFDEETLDAVRARLRSLARRRITDPELPRACVLVPLCMHAGKPGVLFTKRTDTVGTHKGQVSFPGGRRDPTDRDEADCALRELEEEIGLPRAGVDVLGLFHDALSITGIAVTPVVAHLGTISDPRALRWSPAEIDDVFILPLAHLTAPGNRELRELGAFRRAPFYVGGPHLVWGLTAFILDEVLREALGLDVPPLS